MEVDTSSASVLLGVDIVALQPSCRGTRHNSRGQPLHSNLGARSGGPHAASRVFTLRLSSLVQPLKALCPLQFDCDIALFPSLPTAPLFRALAAIDDREVDIILFYARKLAYVLSLFSRKGLVTSAYSRYRDWTSSYFEASSGCWTEIFHCVPSMELVNTADEGIMRRDNNGILP